MAKNSAKIAIALTGFFVLWIFIRGAVLPCVFVWEGASTDVQWNQENLVPEVRGTLPTGYPDVHPAWDATWPHATIVTYIGFRDATFLYADEILGESTEFVASRAEWSYSFGERYRGEASFRASVDIPSNETVDWDEARERFAASFVPAFGNEHEAMQKADEVIARLQAVEPEIRGSPESHRSWEIQESTSNVPNFIGVVAKTEGDDRWTFRWSEARMELRMVDVNGFLTIDHDGNARAHVWGEHRQFYPKRAEMVDSIEATFAREGLPPPVLSDADFDPRC